jgi:hypothetical protein
MGSNCGRISPMTPSNSAWIANAAATATQARRLTIRRLSPALTGAALAVD